MILTAAIGKPLKIEGQTEVTVKVNGLAMTHTIYVIQKLSNPIIVGLDWLILIQAKLDFRSNVPSLQDDIGTAILNHVVRDLSNTLITDDFCILLHRTEQVINVRP